MKNRFSFLILVTFIIFNSTNAQEKLLPIDTLYVSKINDFYTNADQLSDKAWPGMELCPICIFRKNGPAFLYKHPNPPDSFREISDDLYGGAQTELQLFGATQVEINGVLTAIIDYGLPVYSSPDEVFAELFHEIHHVYQRNNVLDLQYDNPVTLLFYPEDYRNDALKITEQKLLYCLCFCDDEDEFMNLLSQFRGLRKKREDIIGLQYLNYEKDVESIEGPAFYCQVLFYQEYANTNDELKKNFVEKDFFGVLNTPYYGRNKLRYRNLASGMAMCYILDKYKTGWKTQYYSSGMELCDFFISQFNVEDIIFDESEVLYSLSEYNTQNLIDEHVQNLDKFYKQNGVKVILNFNENPQFKGFDPMHAEAINDSTVLHSTLLKLQGNFNNELFISGWPVITVFQEQIWNVSRVILYVPDNEIQISDNNHLKVQNDDISISWEGNINYVNKNEIIINSN